MKNILLPLILLSSFGTAFTQSSTRSGTVCANGTGSIAWSNPDNAKISDNSYASGVAALGLFGGSMTTKYLLVQNFGFTIPGSATVTGIVAEIEHSSVATLPVAFSVADHSIMLIGSSGSLVGTDKASSSAWPSADAYQSYGTGTTDKWGASWAPADINSSNFGIAIAANLSALVAVGLTANIDHVKITVYYNIPLPVTLTDFKATLVSGKVELNWQTNAGSQASHFIVERSSDAKNWRRIDSIKSAGNNAPNISYQAYDPYPNNSNYYRVKACDMNGSSSLSPVAFVRYDLQIPPGVKVLMDLNARVAKIQSDDDITGMKLFDLNSRQIDINYISKTGFTNVIYTGNLPRGLYIARVQTKKTAYTAKLLIP